MEPDQQNLGCNSNPSYYRRNSLIVVTIALFFFQEWDNASLAVKNMVARPNATCNPALDFDNSRSCGIATGTGTLAGIRTLHICIVVAVALSPAALLLPVLQPETTFDIYDAETVAGSAPVHLNFANWK